MQVKNRRGHLLRSRANPLVRTSDRVQVLAAVILLAAGFAAIGVALWLGTAAADNVRISDSRWLAASYPATAVATDTGRAAARPAGDGLNSPWLTHVTWTGPDGTRHSGSVVVSRELTPGVPVPVRVGADGWPRLDEPSSPGFVGIVVGVLVLLATWLVLLLQWTVIERLVLRHNLRRWDLEWRKADRQWS